jgi:hypothetical protein
MAEVHAIGCSAASFSTGDWTEGAGGPKRLRWNLDGRLLEALDPGNLWPILELISQSLEVELELYDCDDPGLDLGTVDTLAATVLLYGGQTLALSFSDMMYIGARADSGFNGESVNVLRFRKQRVSA